MNLRKIPNKLKIDKIIIKITIFFQSMKQILILIADCVEDSQIDFPSKTLLTLGYKFHLDSPNKKERDFITSQIIELSEL